MQQKKKHIVIIGAGPAGLTAALELIRKEYAVTVLEATDRIGGISQTVRYGGNRMDIGGHRFFTKDEEVNAWWQQMLPLQGAPAWDDLRTGAQKGAIRLCFFGIVCPGYTSSIISLIILYRLNGPPSAIWVL